MITNDAIVRALGWALAHSLWQATLAALVLLLVMPRLRTAKQRYWAAYCSLAAVFLAVSATFFWCYDPVLNNGAPFFSATELGGVLVIDNTPVVYNTWQSFVAWLDANHALIVACWLLGFAFFLLRLGGGVWQVQRLRSSKVSLPGAEWLEKFQALQQRLGLDGRVVLLESALAQTPMALGWLKPVVLLPIGLVNRLSTAEVEAVLAHELAHIARKDWVFNLVQAFIESVFYYHPAIWWISTVVRRERENCCDDAALAATGNPLAFAKALVQVQEMATPIPALALGLSGTKRRPLLDRVRRILNQPQQKQHQVMEKITATIVLLALLALVGLKANPVPTLEAAFSQISELPETLFNDGLESYQAEQDTVPKPKTTQKITHEDGDKRIEAEYQDGKLTRLNIDGKEIPPAEYESHEDALEVLGSELAEFPTPPSPPSPPFPASFGGVWYAPPSPPDAPQGYRFFSETPAPFPAIAPMRLRTDKDGSGNTIIRFDNDGEATEVVVKDGEVFINGKKIEHGSAIEVPGVYISPQGGVAFPNGAEAFGYSFGGNSDGVEAWAASPEGHVAYFERHAEESREAIAEAMEESKKAMKESRRDYEREMKRSKQDAERYQKEWEKEQKQWEKEQKRWEKDQKVWEQDQKVWEKEQKEWEAQYKANNELLKKELLKDGLISNPEEFSVELNEKFFKVNDKKQSEEMRKKYAELFESMTGNKIGKNGSYMFNVSDDK